MEGKKRKGMGIRLCSIILAGMAAVFCGVTNCPLTALLIIFELFGFDAMPFIIIPVAISYVVSGYFSLYKTQHFHFAKFKGDDNHMVGGV